MQNLFSSGLKKLFILVMLLGGVFAAWVYFSTFHPQEVQEEMILSTGTTAKLQPGQSIKVLSWNVQYMAGNRDNHFFYSGGTDPWPSLERVKQTTDQVAQIIKAEQPDLVLLQEVDENADRTHNTDQQQMLLSLLGEAYPYSTSTFYWKADFIPHPQIMGSAGMKLVVFSKFPIESAYRHRLPEITTDDIVTRQFNLKRAVQEVNLAVENGQMLTVFNAHLSAFAQGSDTMARQINKVGEIINTAKGEWLMGGDFNLLPHDEAIHSLPPRIQAYYNEKETELNPLMSQYSSVPSLEATKSDERQLWYTHSSSDDPSRAPNRTIDYLFYSSGLGVREHYIVQEPAREIADHLPVVATFTLSN